MPYPTLDSLPDGVKNSLPKDAQEIWRNAFNSGLEQVKGDEEKANKIAWGAVKNAGWSKDAEGNWKKSSARSDVDIEIFSVGNWNGDEYTEAHLDEIVKNFDTLKDRVKPPVKLGHKGKWKDGLPALGWVTGLKREGIKLIAKLGQVPDIVYRAIKGGLYKRVSSEIFWNYRCDGKTFGRVLGGIALLGADFPAVDNLEDLEAYMSGWNGDFDRYMVYSAEVENGVLKIYEYKEDHDMGDQEKKEFEAKIKAETEAKVKAEESLEKFKREEAKRVKKADEDTAKSEAENFKKYCEELVKAGKMTPAARDFIMKEESHLYTKDSGISIPVETFKKLNFAKILLEGEKAKEGDKEEFSAAQEEIDATVKKYMADHKDVGYQEAMSSVMAENPDLAKTYMGDVNVDKEGE